MTLPKPSGILPRLPSVCGVRVGRPGPSRLVQRTRGHRGAERVHLGVWGSAIKGETSFCRPR